MLKINIDKGTDDAIVLSIGEDKLNTTEGQWLKEFVERGFFLGSVDARGKELRIQLYSRKCKKCGCTENNGCMTVNGPCSWEAPDLCSACANPPPESWMDIRPSILKIDAKERKIG